jgi:hypothetical protein
MSAHPAWRQPGSRLANQYEEEIIVTAGVPHAGPAARLARAATTAQPRGSFARNCSSGVGAGPLFVLISLVGLTGR